MKTIWSNGAQSICTTTAITTIAQQDLEVNLYPNPAINYVTVETDETAIGGTIQITDVTGREIFPTFTITNSPFTINISCLASGIYFVKISNLNGQSVVKKLVVTQ